MKHALNSSWALLAPIPLIPRASIRFLIIPVSLRALCHQNCQGASQLPLIWQICLLLTLPYWSPPAVFSILLLQSFLGMETVKGSSIKSRLSKRFRHWQTIRCFGWWTLTSVYCVCVNHNIFRVYILDCLMWAFKGKTKSLCTMWWISSCQVLTTSHWLLQNKPCQSS